MSSWLILRTSGPQTLTVCAWLKAAGFDVWTPTATIRQRAPKTERGPVRPAREVDLPILATFVFARAADITALLAIAADPSSSHPRFSLFRVGDRVPVVADRELAGLHRAEERASAELQAIRDGIEREERRKARALQMRTAREQQKALRATGTALPTGTAVEVRGHPAFSGLSAEVLASTDKVTEVQFGSGLSWKVETWLLHPLALVELSYAA